MKKENLSRISYNLALINVIKFMNIKELGEYTIGTSKV